MMTKEELLPGHVPGSEASVVTTIVSEVEDAKSEINVLAESG